MPPKFKKSNCFFSEQQFIPLCVKRGFSLFYSFCETMPIRMMADLDSQNML